MYSGMESGSLECTKCVRTIEWKLCLGEKEKKKRLQERLKILICVAQTKVGQCFLLDFNWSLRNNSEKETNGEKSEESSADRLKKQKD